MTPSARTGLSARSAARSASASRCGGERGDVDLLEQAALALEVDVRVELPLVGEGAVALDELAALLLASLRDAAHVLGRSG